MEQFESKQYDTPEVRVEVLRANSGVNVWYEVFNNDNGRFMCVDAGLGTEDKPYEVGHVASPDMCVEERIYLLFSLANQRSGVIYVEGNGVTFKLDPIGTIPVQIIDFNNIPTVTYPPFLQKKVLELIEPGLSSIIS